MGKMNVLQPTHPLSFSGFPFRHHDANHSHSALSHTSPSLKMSNVQRSRKRKAEDDADLGMSISPTNSPPAFTNKPLTRPQKKVKAADMSGRPLPVHRLLETLDAPSLRSVLQTICDQNPEVRLAVITSAPRPSVEAAAEVLSQYQVKLQAAFPYGGNPGSDYAFNRVEQHLTNLINAMTDFTPHYLPPNEDQTAISLSYLNFATKVIHELPEWDSQAHRHYKDNAYDEISRAWISVVCEASKRGGGFQLHAGGWDQILSKHNEQSRGRMQVVVNAIGSNLAWICGTSSGGSDLGSIRNQLLNGTYGNISVSVGAGQY